MKNRLTKMLFLFISVFFVFSSSVLAFSDIKGDPAEKEIRELKEWKIINGIDDETFAPNKKVTYATGVHLLVKAFDLNIDNIRFIKAPVASDYYSNVKNGKWYSESFIIAHLNGLAVPENVNPNKVMTKEEFAHLLFQALTHEGEFSFIELWVEINDADKINSEYMNSIQKLLITNIAELKDDNFNPKKELTRSDAAKMLHKGILFLKQHNEQLEQEKEYEAKQDEEISLETISLTDDVKKVTLSWGEKSWGHTIWITKVEYQKNGEAIIYYDLDYPKPNEIYIQGMTEPKAHVYLPAEFTPVLETKQNVKVSSNE